MAINTHTGLILVTGVDKPGVTQALFDALSPFSVEVLDVEQLVIRGRLILTVLLAIDPAHAKAIEKDLDDLSLKIKMDIAADFAEASLQDIQFKDEQKRLIILSEDLKPTALANVAAMIEGNIEEIKRRASTPLSVIEIYFTGNLIGQNKIEGADLISIPTELNKYSRKLVVLDVDSTLIKQEAIELLANHAGVATEVKATTDAAMRGEMDFSESLIKRVSLLKGLPESVFEKVRNEIELSPGAENLIASLQKSGHVVGVVSGGFLEIIEPLLKKMKIEHYRANRLEVVDGKLTGKILGEIVDRKAKAGALKAYAEAEKIPLAATIAIGDGANDLDMIKEASFGIAYRAKPAVQSAADAAINTPYLDSVLYFL